MEGRGGTHVMHGRSRHRRYLQCRDAAGRVFTLFTVSTLSTVLTFFARFMFCSCCAFSLTCALFLHPLRFFCLALGRRVHQAQQRLQEEGVFFSQAEEAEGPGRSRL